MPAIVMDRLIVVRHPVALACTFLWIGFVCAISFLEAWLKFQAPGVSLAIGLGIGRLVFATLNKIEWVFAIAIAAHLTFLRKPSFGAPNFFALAAMIALVAQSVWLLPALDTRAERIIQGRLPDPSNLHFYYVAFEAVKVAGLVVFGISLFERRRPSE